MDYEKKTFISAVNIPQSTVSQTLKIVLKTEQTITYRKNIKSQNKQ